PSAAPRISRPWALAGWKTPPSWFGKRPNRAVPEGFGRAFRPAPDGPLPLRTPGKAWRPSHPSKARKIDGRVAIQRLATLRHRVLQAGGAIEQHNVVCRL